MLRTWFVSTSLLFLVGCGVYGRVTYDSDGLEGVTITLSGDEILETTTDEGGNYHLAGLRGGAYLVTPSLAGFDFEPESWQVTISDPRTAVAHVDFEATVHEFSDEEVLDLAYSDYKYPDAFYQEDLGGASIYYENTISITPPDERERVCIELCTDDYEQAYAWSELSNQNSSEHRPLVGESENEKYFEFERMSETLPAHTLLSRVHKCSYLDRSMYDHFAPGEIIGIFNVRPINKANVRELIEYLWFVRHYNMHGSKILSSYGGDLADANEHTLLQTSIVYGDWGICDAIRLIESTYHIDKETGEIFATSETLRTITGNCHPGPF